MALGQLAGGLAWLALSGEDASDLIASAPLRMSTMLRAKIEAVSIVVLAIAAPLVLAVAFVSAWGAIMTALGIFAASAASITIQMWFKSAAKRSQFRRRQVASRTATFAEALSSIFWAITAGFAVAGSWFALFFAVLSLAILAFTRSLSPRT